MFERFTGRARQVVVLAQDEARALRHNYIGTEHILLGLLREQEGIAARVLESLEISIEEVRAAVARIVGQGEEQTTGQIPFTPRAKKALELSMHEAVRLGHNSIGTEHILLGLVRENEGVAARILRDLGADAERVRDEVKGMVAGSLGREETAEAGGRAGGVAPIPMPDVTSVRARRGFRRTPRRVAMYGFPSPHGMLVLGWALFGIASGLGLFVGWLIWG